MLRPLIALAMLVIPQLSLAQHGGGSLPLVGKKLPDLTVFDENGDEFPLRQLRGEYSVIVFGCLT